MDTVTGSHEKSADDVFRTRTWICLSFLLAWAVIAAAHVFFYSYLKRDGLMRESTAIAWREGTLPGTRGTIFDAEGVPLAWTEIYHRLMMFTEGVSAKRKGAVLEKVRAVAPHAGFDDDGRVAVLIPNLAPETAERLQKLMRRTPELVIVPEIRRVTVDYPEVKKYLGKLDVFNAGVSGAELEYEDRLCARSGRFAVMLDRNGGFVTGTFKMLSSPERGRDVTLPLTLSEIQKSGGVR